MWVDVWVGAADNSSQNLFRSKGYVGRGIRWRRSPECSASHLSCSPADHSEPAALSKSRKLLSPDEASPNEETTLIAFCISVDFPFCIEICCLTIVLSILPGPTSRRTAGLPLRSSCIPRENCTGARRWRAQYAGSVASCSEIQVPETQETKGMVGGRN